MAFTPEGIDQESLRGHAAVVIDVFRASTTIVTALVHGVCQVVPVLTPERARQVARAYAPDEVLLAAERGGEVVADFPYGNSPLEYVGTHVRGKVLILTTSNGTRALSAASFADRAAVGAFVNMEGVAEWARAQERDLVVVCAGRVGEVALEDLVCAGMLLDILTPLGSSPALADSARAAQILARYYDSDLSRLARDAAWGRELGRLGRDADLRACLQVSIYPEVPVLLDGILRVSPRPSATCGDSLTSREAAS
ncbi:MAG: 2-phosphosulfolactate phosphatase [Candidatus Methylomirabilia bacterium]